MSDWRWFANYIFIGSNIRILSDINLLIIRIYVDADGAMKKPVMFFCCSQNYWSNKFNIIGFF